MKKLTRLHCGLLAILLTAVSTLTGCGGTGKSPTITPVPRDPSVGAVAVSEVLTFDSQDDRFFLAGSYSFTHHGRRGPGLALAPGAEVLIDLEKLLSGREFPGRWQLVGLQAMPAGAAGMRFENNGQVISASTGGMVGLDGFAAIYAELKPLGGPVLNAVTPGGNKPVVRVTNASGQELVIDDVTLVDNRRVVVPAGSMGGLTVERRGLGTVVQAAGKFIVRVSETEGGWRMEEAGPRRVVFVAESGQKWVMYEQGVSFRRGDAVVLGAADDLTGQIEASHRRPAKLEVTTPGARVDRQASGDGNQDGYDEQYGCYRVAVISAEPGARPVRRLSVRLAPQVPLVYPVIEVSGLPKGKPVVTVAGQLVGSCGWVGDGRLLIVMPVRIDGPAVVNVAVE